MYRPSQFSNYENQLETKKNQRQAQKQLFKQEQLQDSALIQYYIFEDYQNLINLIYSLITVQNYFENDPNNQVVALSRNKIVAQLNLSNTLHQDLQSKYISKQHQQFIKQERKKVLDFISHLPSEIRNSQYLQTYKINSLSDNVKSAFQQLEHISITPNFNQNVVAQTVQSMQLIDQRINQITSSNHYNVPSFNDVQLKANQYQNITQKKLEASFPKSISLSNQQYYQQQKNSSQYVGRSQSCKNVPQQRNQQINQSNFRNSQFQNKQGQGYLANCTILGKNLG
ncbi:unnamed protein product [Paramecium sonneborni]|uniref:Uncharacterized protein n=1 Tax=Paramecium sonneborni TaxID=65129 RepID=A0A8S1P132_9CILI|nr:unnamed protein product [Paramecium sonneborni]